jgi:hypothetical protein
VLALGAADAIANRHGEPKDYHEDDLPGGAKAGVIAVEEDV